MRAFHLPPHREALATWAALLVPGLGLLIYSFVVGDRRHMEAGDPFPGQTTSSLEIVGYFTVTALAAVCLGGLAFLVFASTPDKSHTIDVVGYRAHVLVKHAATALTGVGLAMVVVVSADVAGLDPLTVVAGGHLGTAISVSELAVASIVVTVCAGVTAIAIRLTLSWIGHCLLIVPAAISTIALTMAGNAGQGPDHDYATGLGVVLALAMALSLGIRLARLVSARPASAAAEHIIDRRVQWITLIADITMLTSLVGMVLLRLPARFVFSTAFGWAAMAALIMSALLIASGVLALRRRSPASYLRTLPAMLAALIVVAAWTVMDTRVAPGLLVHPYTGWDVYLGYELTAGPSAWRLLTWWRFDFLFGTIGIIAAVAYVVAVRRLSARGISWPIGRTVSWLMGCAVLVVATGSGLRSFGSAMFSVHMAEHMILNMFVPVLLVLGAPATLALRALPANSPSKEMPPGPREWLLWLLHSRINQMLSGPIPALIIFVASLYAVYFTPIFGTLARYHWGHLLLTAHFLIVGYMFFWVIIGTDPGPRRIPFLARIGLLFGVMPFHAFFGIALMTMSTVVGDKFYSQLPLPWLTDRLDDQWLGGAIAWGASEVPVVLVAVAIVYQWRKVETRSGNRSDRHAETYEDAELDSYNAMLDELARSRK